MISIVDDDESVRAATKALLRSAGYQVEVFASAEDLLNSGVLTSTECLILDVRMPGIDGLELQDRLRASGCAVPIVFISAHDDVLVRRRAIEAGAVAFLRKPFEAARLLAIVENALRIGESQNLRKTQSRASEETADGDEDAFLDVRAIGTARPVPSEPGRIESGTTGRGRRAANMAELNILLVDDEISVRRYASAVLQDAGCHVKEAADGVDALAVLHVTGGAVDVLVTDVRMPRMTGIELVKAVRDAFPNIAVVYISAEPLQQQLHNPQHRTMFLQKPFSCQAMLSAVRATMPAMAASGRALD